MCVIFLAGVCNLCYRSAVGAGNNLPEGATGIFLVMSGLPAWSGQITSTRLTHSQNTMGITVHKFLGGITLKTQSTKKRKKWGIPHFSRVALKKRGIVGHLYKKRRIPLFCPLFLGMTSIPKKKGGWEVHHIPPKKARWPAVAPILFFFGIFLFFVKKKNSNFQNCIPRFGFAQGSFYARLLAKCFDAKLLLGKIDFRSSIF